MTNNEFLLAISDIVEKKVKAELQPIKNDLCRISNEQTRINLIIENEIRSDVKLLAENYLPAAQRYENETAKIDALQADIEVIKKVVAEHSDKINNIA